MEIGMLGIGPAGAWVKAIHKRELRRSVAVSRPQWLLKAGMTIEAKGDE